MLVLVILAIVWGAVIGSWAIGNRRAGRPDNSVASFRAQLSTLERATPGTSLRPPTVVGISSHPGSSPSVSPRSAVSPPTTQNTARAMKQVDARRRRRWVLVGLLASTGVTFVLGLAVGGAVFTLLWLATVVSLGAYVTALRQRKLRSMERVAKVRTLVPRTSAAPAPPLALRRTASN
jgi:hypothetical protein